MTIKLNCCNLDQSGGVQLKYVSVASVTSVTSHMDYIFSINPAIQYVSCKLIRVRLTSGWPLHWPCDQCDHRPQLCSQDTLISCNLDNNFSDESVRYLVKNLEKFSFWKVVLYKVSWCKKLEELQSFKLSNFYYTPQKDVN